MPPAFRKHPASEPSGLDASSDALNSLTTDASKLHDDPKHHIHAPADHEASHTWLGKLFPASAQDALEAK